MLSCVYKFCMPHDRKEEGKVFTEDTQIQGFGQGLSQQAAMVEWLGVDAILVTLRFVTATSPLMLRQVACVEKMVVTCRSAKWQVEDSRRM
jgi:hypothetical protein